MTPVPLESLIPRLREAGVHSIIYGLGTTLQAGLGFLLLPIYVRHFDPATYGIFALLVVIGSLTGVVLSLGAPSAVARSYFDYTDPDARKRVVGTSLNLVLTGGFIVLLVGVPLASRASTVLFDTPEYALHLCAAAATAFFAQLNAIFLVLLRFLRKSALVVQINVGVVLGSLLLIWFLMSGLGLGLWGPILGLLISQFLQFIVLWAACRHDISWLGMRREGVIQLRYGLPAAVVGLQYYLMDSADRMLMSKMLDLEAVGVYSVGYRIGMAIQILLVQPFGQIWTPMRLEYRHEPEAPRLFGTILTYYTLIGLCMTVTIALFAPEIIMVIGAQEKYGRAWTVVGLVMLGHLAYGAIGVVDCGIIFERKVGFHVWGFSASLILNIALNLLLIPRYGIVGAALATFLSYGALVIMAGAFSQRLYKVQWEYRRIGTAWALAICALLLTLLPGGSGLSVRLLILAASIAGWIIFVLTSEERSLVARLIQDATAKGTT